MKNQNPKRRIISILSFTLLTASVAFSPAMAQTKCKYVKNFTDEWTKQETRTAQMAIGVGLAGREVILQESEGKLYLGLRITYNTDFPEVPFKKGDKITFKLADDRQVEIAAGEDVPATNFRMLDVALRQWFVRQEVKADIYKQLSASPITAIKFHLNGADYPLPEIKERQTRKIMETAQCILDTI